MDLSLRFDTIQQDDQSWLGSAHGTSMARPITLDASAFTAGTHYPNGYLPSGTAVSKNTSTGLYGPYVSAGANGTGTLAGFTLTATAVRASTSRPQAPLYTHGRVVVANLPFASGNGFPDATAQGQTSRFEYV